MLHVYIVHVGLTCARKVQKGSVGGTKALVERLDFGFVVEMMEGSRTGGGNAAAQGKELELGAIELLPNSPIRAASSDI